MNTAQKTTSRSTTMSAAAVLIAALAVTSLAACSKKEDASVGSQVDSAIAKTEQKAGELKADASKELGEAKSSASEMAKDAKAAIGSASDKAGEKVADAVITTSVNAEIAKDQSLSALKINVDTADGRVALRGTAPTASARERATTLASAVKGVVSVDNQLTVDAAKL